MPGDTSYPEALESVISALKRLPGIGKRTAERLALAMLTWDEQDLVLFGEDVAQLRRRIRHCRVCGNLADTPVCRVCTDPSRQQDVICVVEQASQIPVLERSGAFRGLYHVLGGRIVPLEGIGPEDLHIAPLHERIADGQVRELILALTPDIEGEATASYLVEEFRDSGVCVSRIASGVPVGADLSFADPATLSMALNARRQAF
jgi:recombination protein RecR